jgi:hypothetical protein
MLVPSPVASHAPPDQHPQMAILLRTIRRRFERNAGYIHIGGAKCRVHVAGQTKRLVDLLPHEDKDVSGGLLYFRRAGQDIFAIGKYLEDEKNVSVPRD